jgi:CP family cyanate transporter-like MFS transporter
MRSAKRPVATHVPLFVALLAVALNLRLAIVAVGPVVEDIRADTGMSSAVGGMFVTIPYLCMGVFAYAGVPLVRRLGPTRVITCSLVAISVGTLARAAAPDADLIVAFTCVLGVGLALAGTTLPGVVKAHFADRPGAVTGAYVAALSGGAGIAALLAAPLSEALGSWRWALALSALPALVALPLWIASGATRERGEARVARAVGSARLPRRVDPVGLRLAVMFALQSATFMITIGWIAALYRDEGWSPEAAGLTTAVIPLATIPAAILIPRLSDHGDRRRWLLVTAMAMGTGALGLGLAPTLAPWLWIGLFSLGSGSQLALALSLPLDLGVGQQGIARLTAWTLGFGYILSAPSAVLAGALRDVTGEFALPMILAGIFGIGSGLLAQTPLLRAVRPVEPQPASL